jgi:hypothetical protein
VTHLIHSCVPSLSKWCKSRKDRQELEVSCEHRRLKSCRGHAVELSHGRNVEASNACGRMLAPIDESPSFIRQRYVGVLTIVSRGGYGPRGSGQRTGIKRSGPASPAPSFPLPALELTKAGLAALCNIGLDPPELCKAQLLLTALAIVLLLCHYSASR